MSQTDTHVQLRTLSQEDKLYFLFPVLCTQQIWLDLPQDYFNISIPSTKRKCNSIISIHQEERKNHLSKSKYTNYNDLPLMLSVPDVASVLGISRAGAYELVRSDGFPSLRIGSRIIVPKEKFIDWINANTNA